MLQGCSIIEKIHVNYNFSPFKECNCSGYGEKMPKWNTDAANQIDLHSFFESAKIR